MASTASMAIKWQINVSPQSVYLTLTAALKLFVLRESRKSHLSINFYSIKHPKTSKIAILKFVVTYY